uniref:C2H2-type domain-containing protein n=1 Tax=Romanomermis culicivorax TaxID=13658 RepID=A0A915JXJ0_ROMCU
MVSKEDAAICSSIGEFLEATGKPDTRSKESIENDLSGQDNREGQFPKHLNAEEPLIYKFIPKHVNQDIPDSEKLNSMISKLPQTSMVFVINSLPNGSESVDLVSLTKIEKARACDTLDVNLEGEVLEGAELKDRRRPNPPKTVNRNPENFIPCTTNADRTIILESAVQKSLLELREKIKQRGVDQSQIIGGLPVRKKIIKVDIDSPNEADDESLNDDANVSDIFYGDACSLANKKEMLAKLVHSNGKFDLTKYPTFPRGTNFTYPCPFCDYTNTKRHLIIRHLRTHSSDKPHACTQCGKTFKAADSLRIHLYSHRNIKPRQCKQCGDTFAATSGLVRHIRYKHTKEKPFKCTHCGLSFVESFKLKQHLRSSADHDHIYQTVTIEETPP